MTAWTNQLLRDAVSGRDTTFVYSFGCDWRAGFGADYLGFLAKLIWCLQHGVEFRFCTVHQAQGFIAEHGWTDYFEPFCDEADGPLLERFNIHEFPYARKIPITKAIVGAWFRATVRPKAHYFSFDTLPDLPVVPSPFTFDDYLQDRKRLIEVLWQYNDQTAREVQAVEKPFAPDDDYVAICVRRGDKLMEHDYVGIDAYVAKIEGSGQVTRKIFVATDDASVVGALKEKLPGYELQSLTETVAKGYVHADFKRLPASERRRRTVRFFAQLEMLRDARLFIGSRTTNVSWMANALRGGKRVEWVD